MKRFSIYSSLLSLFVLLTGVSLAQPMGPGQGSFEGRGQPDGSGIIKKLNRALEHAGGEELLLSAGQEEAIAALVAEQLANRPPRDPENRNLDHFKAYGDAIMAGDQAAIERIAAEMADKMAERTEARLVSQANFQIALLGILDGDQLNGRIDLIVGDD